MFIVDVASRRLDSLVFDDESDRPEMEEAMDLIYDRVPFEGGYGTESHGHLVGHPHTHTREPEPDSVEKAEFEAA